MQSSRKIADLLVEKFVSEEIMTKSEFQLSIDRIMDKHEVNIASRFSEMEARMDRQFLKIDVRYNWIIGIVLTSVIALGSLMIKLLYSM